MLQFGLRDVAHRVTLRVDLLGLGGWARYCDGTHRTDVRMRVRMDVFDRIRMILWDRSRWFACARGIGDGDRFYFHLLGPVVRRGFHGYRSRGEGLQRGILVRMSCQNRMIRLVGEALGSLL